MKKRGNSGKRRRLNGKVRASVRRTKLILGIPTTPQDWRGFAAEDKAECALEHLKKEKLMREYRRTTRFGLEDLEGKDFIVELLNGDTLAIDVKNHRCRQKEEERAREKGIWLLTIWPDDTEEITREKTLALIVSGYLSGLGIGTARAIISGAVIGIPEESKEMPGLPRALLSLMQKIRK